MIIIELLPVMLATLLLFLAVSLFFIATSLNRNRTIKALLICLVLELTFCFLLCWFFRDGMGPNAVTSTGWIAWSRVFTEMIPVGIFIVIVLVIASLGYRTSRKRIQKKNEKP